MSKLVVDRVKKEGPDVNIEEEAIGLGDFLQRLRLRAGLSQKEVALVLGFDNYQFIYNMEKGKCLPPRKHIKSLARIFKIEERKIRLACVKHIYSATKKKYGFK